MVPSLIHSIVESMRSSSWWCALFHSVASGYCIDCRCESRGWGIAGYGGRNLMRWSVRRECDVIVAGWVFATVIWVEVRAANGVVCVLG